VRREQGPTKEKEREEAIEKMRVRESLGVRARICERKQKKGNRFTNARL